LLSRVRLETDKNELLGHGKVRYCRPMGTEYIIGIEFTDSLHWRAPDDPVTEPIPLCAPPPEDELLSATLPEPADTTRLIPEPQLSPGSGTSGSFLARLPIAVKAGAAVFLALLLGAFFMGHSGTTSASSHRVSMVGEEGWVTEWASDTAGSKRGRQITFYRPSSQLSDYQMKFDGQIESKALGWVFRAADTKNYYGMKIEKDGTGSVLYTRFAVVNGRQTSIMEKRLPIQARVDTVYNVRLEIRGPRFSVYIQGEPVELWSDSRLKTGALGFMNDREDRGRINSVRFSL
jgi:hypothetical protein